MLYAHAFLIQTAQTALANGRSKNAERLARWLLMADDRIDGGELPLTHKFLSIMLGVQRPGVTLAAGELQRAGMIRYTRGNVTILDHSALMKRSCECYAVSKKEFDRLLGATAKSSDGKMIRD